MQKSLLIVLLAAVILALLVPLTSDWYSLERAFTPNNLVRINLVSK